MNIEEQIQGYIDCLESNKKDGLLNLHPFIKALIPHAKLWFLDGKDANGKVIANPNLDTVIFNYNIKMEAQNHFTK